MPVRNQFFLRSSELLQEIRNGAAGLEAVGPRLPAELHLPVQLAELNLPVPRPVAGDALIDTGASRTVVAEDALQQLGVQPVGLTQVLTPSGQELQLLYPVAIAFVGTPERYSFSQVVGSPHLRTQGLLALIGRDLLAGGLLVYNGHAGMFTLAL